MKFEERMKIVDEECLRRDLLAHNASEVAKDADTEITTLTAKLEAATRALELCDVFVELIGGMVRKHAYNHIKDVIRDALEAK